MYAVPLGSLKSSKLTPLSQIPLFLLFHLRLLIHEKASLWDLVMDGISLSQLMLSVYFFFLLFEINSLHQYVPPYTISGETPNSKHTHKIAFLNYQNRSLNPNLDSKERLKLPV